jgi:hypothetical protein
MLHGGELSLPQEQREMMDVTSIISFCSCGNESTPPYNNGGVLSLPQEQRGMMDVSVY